MDTARDGLMWLSVARRLAASATRAVEARTAAGRNLPFPAEPPQTEALPRAGAAAEPDPAVLPSSGGTQGRG